jgi:hypothetical protein
MLEKVFQITRLRLVIKKTFSSICDVENTILTCPPHSILSLPQVLMKFLLQFDEFFNFFGKISQIAAGISSKLAVMIIPLIFITDKNLSNLLYSIALMS